MKHLAGLFILVASMALDSSGRIQGQTNTTYLTAPQRLVRTPVPGAISHFQIGRLEETIDSQGQVTSRTRSTGSFSREVLYINENGTWMDRYRWSSFFSGRSTSPSDSIAEVEVTAVRDFTYDLPSDDRFSLPPIPIGGLAKTPETYAFFVVVWDAATFMQAATNQPAYPLARLTRIGDRISETAPRKPAQFDFTPTVSDFNYKRAPFSATFSGITRVADTPCALLNFESGANTLALHFATDLMQTDLAGSEWIRGTLSIRLDTATIMAGTMNNMLVATQTATVPGKIIQSPIVFRQSITLKQVIKE